MNILGIESSCDDTSISIVKDGKEILSNVTFSQIKKHEKYFGVVPEIASREHLKIIDFVFNEAIKSSGLKPSELDAIAVTSYPGLIGSLIIGVNFAKGLSICLNKPLISVNHLLAHVYSAFINNNIKFPILALIISGGHTAIIKMENFFNFEIIGKTIDDATGEAFDKISKYFELGYPGGPIIEKLSKIGNENAYSFPIPLNNLKKYGLNFSFSGIKTAVMYHRKKFRNRYINTDKYKIFLNPKNEVESILNQKDYNFYKNIIKKQEYLKNIKKLDENENLFDIAASFQKAIADSLYIKLKFALQINHFIKTIIIAGGVSANNKIRNTILNLSKIGYDVFFPPLELCMDNGAMVAGIAYHYYQQKIYSDLNLNPYSRISSLKRGSMI